MYRIQLILKRRRRLFAVEFNVLDFTDIYFYSPLLTLPGCLVTYVLRCKGWGEAGLPSDLTSGILRRQAVDVYSEWGMACTVPS